MTSTSSNPGLPFPTQLWYWSWIGRLLVPAIFTTFAAVSQAENELNIPPALTGPVYDLNMQTGTTQFLGGNATTTSGYNGNFLGPTLIMNSGDFVTLNVTNSLGEETTTHWHGMHVSPSDDGGPHTTIAAGATWSPDFTVLDTASTMWYHPHLHGNTHRQVNMGLAGLILVRDAVEADAGLPVTYGVDEFPLILQDRKFAGDNSFQLVALGEDLLINGTLDPYLDVPAQVVRFRVLNGSNERGFNLGMSDGRTFQVVGADGGLLAAPAPVTRLLMMPGERVDMLIDFGSDDGSTLSLTNFGTELPNYIPGNAGSQGGAPNPLNGTDVQVVQFRVGAASANPVTAIPTSMASLSIPSESEAAVTRSIQMTGGGPGDPFLLDSQAFDIARIDQTVLMDQIEVWTLTNRTATAHPFHIHDIQFYILDRNGEAPPAHEAGKKDTVIVKPDETVRFITQFDTFADTEVPYMYHCHILPHEDGGMMAQFIVVDPASQLIEITPGSTDVTLRWSLNLATFQLQTTTDLDTAFSAVGTAPTEVDGKNQVTWTRDTDLRFFRLLPN